MLLTLTLEANVTKTKSSNLAAYVSGQAKGHNNTQNVVVTAKEEALGNVT